MQVNVLHFISYVDLVFHIDTFLKYQTISQQCSNEEAYINAKAYLLKTCHYESISLYE
jgi:hypothetical protein